MATNLVIFDSLKADISLYVKPTLSIAVSDAKSGQEAIEAGKLVKGYQIMLEKKRKEMVEPLSAQVKAINDYAKSIAEPLLAAESHIKGQLVAFERQLEITRLAALKAEQERRDKAEAEARAEQEKAAAELAEKHRAQLARIEPESDYNPLGSDDEIDLIAQQAREAAEAQAAIERENAVRKAADDLRVYDIKQEKVKNSAKTWKCELVDIEKVPAHFVTKTLNTSMVIAAARGGTTEIPGVKLWQDTSVRFGANTSMGSLTQKG